MHKIQKIVFFLSAILVLAACASRGAISVVTDSKDAYYTAPIFVATNRVAAENPVEFTKARSSHVHLARYDISVPKTHTAGQIEWPKGSPNLQADMVTINVENYGDRTAFIQSANKYKKDGEDAVVFIHGYNNTFAEGLYRMAQLSHDLDISGPKYHFAWPSAGNPRGYAYDRDSVLFARDGLEQLLTDVAKTNTDGIFLVAHSIGAALAIETLRQMSISGNNSLRHKLRGVILISPDIDVQVFTENLKRINPQPDPLLIFVSKKDIALRVASFLTGAQNRLGVIDNLDALSGTNVEIIDVSTFTDGAGILNHSVAITSPTLLNILKNQKTIETILDTQPQNNKGSNIVSRVVQTANNVTQIILNPKVTP